MAPPEYHSVKLSRRVYLRAKRVQTKLLEVGLATVPKDFRADGAGLSTVIEMALAMLEQSIAKRRK